MDLRKSSQFKGFFLDSTWLENPLLYARRPWCVKNFPWNNLIDDFRNGVAFKPLFEFDDHEVGTARNINDVIAPQYFPAVVHDELMRQKAKVIRAELGFSERVWGMEYGLRYEPTVEHVRPAPIYWSQDVVRNLFTKKHHPLDQKTIYYFQMLIAGGLENFKAGFDLIDKHGVREDLLEFSSDKVVDEWDIRHKEQMFSDEDFLEFYKLPIRDQLVSLASQMQKEDIFLARRIRRALRWEFISYLRTF